MEETICNLCGSDDYVLLYQMPDKYYHQDEVFNVVQCTRCGLGYLNPRPTFEEISKYYPKSFYDEFKHNQPLHAERYRREEAYILPIRKIYQEPILLDIGCAEGDFLWYLYQRGWQVEGLEPIAAVKEELPFPIYHNWLTEVDFMGKTYHVVTAWAVLEHVHDPMAYFAKVAQLLKPRGWFVFLVNNLRSFQSRFLFAEDPPRHLFFFSEKTIRGYLSKVGLKIIKVDYTDRIYSMPPRHWLEFLISRLIGKEFNYPPPKTFSDFMKNRKNPKPTIMDKIRFSVTHPISTLDALGVPFVTKLQIWLRVYGNTVYIAEKEDTL